MVSVKRITSGGSLTPEICGIQIGKMYLSLSIKLDQISETLVPKLNLNINKSVMSCTEEDEAAPLRMPLSTCLGLPVRSL